VKLLYFAWIREKVGTPNEEVSLPDNVNSVADLIKWQIGRGEGYAEAFSDLSMIRVAVNQEYVSFEHSVDFGDEIAFFPPMTGG
jgi:molybdopterin synthase sulfur carrier subunit